MKTKNYRTNLARLAVMLVLAVMTSAAAWGQEGNYDYWDNTYKVGYNIYGDEAYVDKGENPTGEISIKSSITVGSKTYPVTSIGYNAFYECTGITRVIGGSNLTEICNYAFYGCTSLTTFGLTSVKIFGDHAFEGCTALWSVSFNNKVESIGSMAFYNCTNLHLSNVNAVNIDDQAFYGCKSVENITLSRIKTIGFWAFECCEELTSVRMTTVETIGSRAFSRCPKLSSVTVGTHLKSIGFAAFESDGSNLNSITLKSNPYMDDNAFPNHTSITMQLTAKSAEGAYWTTFYNNYSNFRADANTQIFKASLDGTRLTLTELTADKIIPKGTPVILKSSSSTITLERTSSASGNDFSGNSLNGAWDEAGLVETDGTFYVLNKTAESGLGFYKLASGKTIDAGKAYLTYSGSGALAKEFFGFDESSADGIGSIDNGQLTIDN